MYQCLLHQETGLHVDPLEMHAKPEVCVTLVDRLYLFNLVLILSI